MGVVEPIRAEIVATSDDAITDGAARRLRGPLRPAALASTRQRISAAAVARTFITLDGFLVIGVAFLAAAIRHVDIPRVPFGQVLPVIVGSCAILGLMRSARTYVFPKRERWATHLAKVAGVMLAAGAGAVLTALMFGQSPVGALGWLGLLACCLIGAHGLWWRKVSAWRAAGRMTPNVVVVGATDNARKLIEAALETQEVAILGVFDDRLSRAPQALAGVPVLGDTAALLSHPLLPYMDRIVITVSPAAQARVRDLIDRLRILPNAVTLFMDVDGAAARSSALTRLANTDLTQVSGAGEDERRAFAKRIQDLVLGVPALILALPLMLLIALAIRLDSPGPVLFRQRRHGFNNEAITVWKFRSMRADMADATASRQVSKDDPRVTRVGRVLRKLSLDELPQLINVAMGEMSLVGPRPHAIGMMTSGQESARLVAEYAWRHRMKPGITGWAQVNGSIGAIDTPEQVRRRVGLDVEYIETHSFWFDLYILAITLPALIRVRDVVR